MVLQACGDAHNHLLVVVTNNSFDGKGEGRNKPNNQGIWYRHSLYGMQTSRTLPTPSCLRLVPAAAEKSFSEKNDFSVIFHHRLLFPSQNQHPKGGELKPCLEKEHKGNIACLEWTDRGPAVEVNVDSPNKWAFLSPFIPLERNRMPARYPVKSLFTFF
jgi:hypothetical protein